MDKRILAIDGGTPAITLPHPAPWPIITEEAKCAIDTILQSGMLYGYRAGGIIDQLEKLIAAYHIDTTYVLAQGSGTEALHAAYVGIGLEPGDEVIVSAYTYVATATPLFICGAVPVLCDVEEDTGNLNPALIESRMTERTRAIVVTHVWGHPAEMDEICAIARRRGVKVIEDCSHAHGSLYRGRHVGTIGDVGIFSMGAAKMVTGGMGGAMMTNDPDIYERALILGHCRGRAGDTLVSKEREWLADTGYGANHRITLLAACLCLDQFKSLDERIKEKHEVLNSLSDGIADVAGIKPPVTRPYVSRGAWYGYTAQFCPDQLEGTTVEQIFAAAKAEGMKLRHPRSKPLHLLDAFQRGSLGLATFDRVGSLQYGAGDFPIAERFYQQSIGFPTKNFHFRCAPFVSEYVAGVRKIFDAARTREMKR